MAPVGRWQKGKDLSWYAKSDSKETDGDGLVDERQEELRRVKQAEEEAMAKALGLPTPPSANANMQPLGPQRGGESKELSTRPDSEPRKDGDSGRRKRRDIRERRSRSREHRSHRHKHEHRRRHDNDRSTSRDRYKDRRSRSRSRSPTGYKEDRVNDRSSRRGRSYSPQYRPRKERKSFRDDNYRPRRD